MRAVGPAERHKVGRGMKGQGATHTITSLLAGLHIRAAARTWRRPEDQVAHGKYCVDGLGVWKASRAQTCSMAKGLPTAVTL